ncbi:MAG: hypothetical protein OXC46_08670 [Thaumarchaeota archaeon]|nr:hypothetical protein [Nitrososphaerota archaeon]
MKICTICKKISATGQDHLDCIQMRQVTLEDEDLKRLVEKTGASNSGELGVEIRAILEHLSREKNRTS